ncbi:sacsin N-terminal ATP-binding-like domain-containing protein [Herbiconiux sp. VKM Ac-2851]|uniref:sacsin N-terminal ATP-binding-like domain-containing protein n=1 Tax=Herbiconiux sp. VKM Ac-2851 TaxID=2739025 RepID=UPI0015647F74|nr:helicase-related protein [Herbiconiux sp. VKM Ac-2851]NQX33298.1 DEAD/DEAH box helicase family protein [Herbiconiux sp. VKM Ac-2851]
MTTDRQAWEADPRLAREVEDQFTRTIEAYRIHPNLVSEHANHEESIQTGGYASRTLLELVQNAADALAGAEDTGSDSAGRVEIVLDTENSVLYCANAGRPFSLSGLTAVTMAYLSEKRGDEIGRFGLGFKSVLAVSQTPQVFSRSISFEFNSPRARTELANIATARRYPVLRTATLLDATAELERDPILAELGSWASTIVRLPGATNLERLQTEIQEFTSEFLLFVGAVREVRLRVLGDDLFETSHVSRDLGNKSYRIERPDGTGDEWIVDSAMHRPSSEARHEVGEAVSRDAVKVTVAVPSQRSRVAFGQFWSYFPLQDKTSVAALLNAPWSVNDDRTNLLENRYNQEIIRTLAELFVPLLPRMRSADEPAAHLDYLPARERDQESRGFAGDALRAHVNSLAGAGRYIPDPAGTLRNGSELRPLDPAVRFDPPVHLGWTVSPNTGEDVPHWHCYRTSQRALRLRELLLVAQEPDLDPSSRDVRAAMERMPKRGLLTWLREWAEGDDPVSSANAFRTVLRNLSLEDISTAKVIPTSDGMKSLTDSNVVFLRREEGLDVDGAVFVDPAFLLEDQVEQLLVSRGFRNLDPEAILNARLAMLSSDPSGQDLEKLWDAAISVSLAKAVMAMTTSKASVKVPTRDGGWAWPQQVIDVDVVLPERFASRLLDRRRCMPEVAHGLGVAESPVEDFSLEDEAEYESYVAATVEALNTRRGPGERPVERVDVSPGHGPGPFSALLMLRDAEAPVQLRAAWTMALLTLPERDWTFEDLDTGRSHGAMSPSRWAVQQAGILPSSRGFRAPDDIVAPSLVRFGALLPLFKGSHQVQAALDLPDDLAAVPPHVLREMLEADVFPTVDDAVLSEFILTATRVGYAGAKPSTIPARVTRVVEAHSPTTVFLASTDDEVEILRSRQRPYLRVDAEKVEEFVETVGCRRFTDSFSFAMVVEGQQDSQRILDAFTGLRSGYGAALGSAKFARALLIAKRVVTEDGTEDQPRDWHLDGQDLIVRSDVDDRRILEFINDAFDLRLNNAHLTAVLKAGLNHQLELMRQQAQAIKSDADRLDLYIGPDDLMEALPTGLWSALEAQGLVNSRTSVAELFLTVFGSDALLILADRFRALGFSDVPEAWAGTRPAVTWVRKMGFSADYAGQRNENRPSEFVVPGAVVLNRLHTYQKRISEDLRTVLTQPSDNGPGQKAMVELPTGAGKTRVATETVLKLFVDEVLSGTILWIAQSEELCEQAVQTFQTVWRYLADERSLTIGRLWGSNTVQRPDTELSVIVATDAQLEKLIGRVDYEWLSTPAAVFVDEAHRAGSARYTAILRWLGVDGRSWDRPLVGLSATPFKGRAGDHSGTKELKARFGKRLAIPDPEPYKELVKLGVLASVKHEVLPSGIEVELNDSERVALSSSRLIDRNVYERIGRSEERMRILIEHIVQTLEAHPDWPILVFTPSVLSAQVLSASLRYRGLAAESVSGQTSRQQRRKVITQFQAGEIQVLANCDLLVQGFDAPGVRALYIARPTFSPGAYIQMAGRGLRGTENGGKEECLIVDIADNWGAMNDFLGYHDYENLWTEQRG